MDNYNNYRQKNYVKLTKNEYEKTSKRHKPFRRTVYKRLLILFCIVGVVLMYLEFFISPVIKRVATTQIDTLTVKALNEAIRTELNAGLKYDDFVNVISDNNNRIVMLQAKTANINNSVSRITKSAQEQIDYFSDSGISLPLGVFSGVQLLAGYGPDVNVKINTQGYVYITFQSEFVGQGINQTLHRIYVNLVSQVSIVVPTIGTSIKTQIQMLLTEAVILGEVPNIVLSGFSTGGIFN